MRQFSQATKIYIWAVVACGAFAFACAASLGIDARRWPLLLLGCILALLSSSKTILLFGRRGKSENNSTMSVGFVPTFFILVTLGPLAGMLAAAMNALATTCWPWKRRAYYYQVLFSIASVLVAVFAAALVLRPVGLARSEPGHAITLTDPHRLGLQIAALVAATLVYFLINTFTVAIVLAMISGKNALKTWVSHFLLSGIGYFAGMSCAVMAHAGLVIARDYQGNAYVTLPWAALAAFFAIWIPVPIGIFLLLRFKRDKEQANERHIDELQRKNDELKNVFLSTVESLALAIESKDRYTKEHILRVQDLSVAIAEELGLCGDELEAIQTGALLHDIGKIGIPEQILGKPGKLTDEEYNIIKKHPDLGAKILHPVPFPYPVMGAVRSHHERWDGKGYPDGLAGEGIPLQGRILAVADVYDALTSDRAYREGWPHERAMEYIRENAGTHFDPVMVNAFVAVIENRPELARPKSQAAGGAANGTGGGTGSNGFHTAPATAPNAPPPDKPQDTRDQVNEGITRASFEYLSLYEISQTVSATLNLDETLTLLAGNISRIFNASACALFLWDDDTGNLAVRQSAGINEVLLEGARARRVNSGGITEQVAQTGAGYVGAYDSNDLIYVDDTIENAFVPFASCAIAPLVADDKVIGTVNLYNEGNNAFDPEDLRVLLSVSAQAGRAIRNAREYEATRESARRDPVTGLHNARYLSEFIETEIERVAAGENGAFSVVVMDLDNFKPVNDTFGHSRGDDVLREIGQAFMSVLRGDDLVTRYRGDEFVVVLPGAERGDAAIVMEKLRAAVTAYSAANSAEFGNIPIGVSLGASTFPEDGANEAALVAHADKAMYQDKNARKDLTAGAAEKNATGIAHKNGAGETPASGNGSSGSGPESSDFAQASKVRIPA